MSTLPPWKPARWEQHLLWWLKLLMRYPIGGGGVIYEALIAKDPIGTLVFGAIATSLDIGSLALTLLRAAAAQANVEIDRDDRPGP